MASYNKIIIMGYLTRDPQLSYLPSQTPVVEFGLASTHKYKGSDGQMREYTCFVDCKCYGARAETISKYCQKGRPLLVEGRLTLDKWEAQDGSKRSKHLIFVEKITFVDSRNAGANSDTSRSASPAQSASAVEGEVPAAPAAPEDDIPF